MKVIGKQTRLIPRFVIKEQRRKRRQVVQYPTHRYSTAMSAYDVRSAFETFSFSSKEDAPADTIFLKVLYPASEETNYIQTTPDMSRAPFPVVIFLGGALVESNRYQWLGERLVRDLGVVFVLPQIIIDAEGGYKVMLPSAWHMTNSGITNVCIHQLFEKLKLMNETGLLVGCLNLNHVVMGGHSIGGKFVLQFTSIPSFVKITGIFSYGCSLYRKEENLVLDGMDAVSLGTSAVLLMGGNKDEIAKSGMFGSVSAWNSAIEPVEHTYEAYSNRECWLIEFEGFNHFAFVYPEDLTTGTGFIDGKATVAKSAMLEEFATVLSFFVRQHALGDLKAKGEMEFYLKENKNKLVKSFRHKNQIPE